MHNIGLMTSWSIAKANNTGIKNIRLLNSAKYQYSERDARPSNFAYF